jgi:hypothetical protein
MTTSDLYGELRPRAFAIAYQMLGSVSEAEDVVQEAFLRMHQTLQRDEQITSPRAYIGTTTDHYLSDTPLGPASAARARGPTRVVCGKCVRVIMRSGAAVLFAGGVAER